VADGWQAVAVSDQQLAAEPTADRTEHYDLIIIGAGSGNSLICPEMDGWRIAMVERGLFGGTCLNVGCIPTKMFVYAADVARSAEAEHSAHYGVRTTFEGADWPSIVHRVFGRIDPIAEGGRQYRHSNPNVDVFEHTARFVGERTVHVGDRVITGERIVIAAGAHSFIPPVPGLDEVPFHTSDTIMRIDRLPRHLVVMGGGFVATELGHVFRSLGSEVTIVNRSHRLLMNEDHDISQRFTELAADRYRLLLGASVERVYMTADGVGLRIHNDDGEHLVEGDQLLVAAGRVGNGCHLDVHATGIELDAWGNVPVDAYGRTSCPGVWALGDVVGRHMLKHMANGEARVVQHNLLHPEQLQRLDERAAPHAVFSSPQVGSVGITEQQAQRAGTPYVAITHGYGGAAYGWAMEDTTSICKLIGDPATRQLLGAHIVGPQASILVQLLVQGMHLGTTVDEMATGQIWIHPALSEVVEQALLQLAEAFDARA
jgi:mycothione reductase